MGNFLFFNFFMGGVGLTPLSAADSKPPSAASTDTSSGASPRAILSQAVAYDYSPVGKRDPFEPFMETDPAVKARLEAALKKKIAKKAGPVSPLQKVNVGQFRLVGTVGDDSRCVAIVEDEVSKKFYPIIVGTYIGLNEGRVTEILPDRVVIEEGTDRKTKAKKEQVKRVTLMLHKEEEGKYHETGN